MWYRPNMLVWARNRSSGYRRWFNTPGYSLFASDRSTKSFGPLLSERAETIGMAKVSVGVHYQRFTFDKIEGVDLSQVSAVFTHDNPAPGGRDDVVTTDNAIDVSVSQLTGYLNYGLSSWLAW